MNIKKLLKKKSIIVLLGIFIISIIGVKLSLNVFATSTYDISVLEIEPGDKFKLTNGGQSIDPFKNDKNKKVVEREEIIKSKDGTNVKVTHINMPEFISMVDEISGQYDCVVVGRENSGLESQYKLDEYSNEQNYVYRDYTNPFSQVQKENLNMFSGDFNNGIEYYCENDITNKRAKQIVNMIEKQQLVYMDERIGSDTYTEILKPNSWQEIKFKHESIRNTNIYKLYKDFNDKVKIYSTDDNISIEKIVNDYGNLTNDKKRPVVTNIIKPISDDKLAPNVDNRKMQFEFSAYNPDNEELIIKLFLDTNGDGLFKDSEFESEAKIDVKQNNEYEDYSIEYNLDEDFIGYLGWKIEVCKQNGVKTNIISNNIFGSLNKAKDIKVLQIYPSDWNKGVLTNDNFESLIQNEDFSKNYNVKINPIGSVKFNEEVKNGSLKLNGNYDMVIIGFADNYVNAEFNKEAIDELKSYMKTGQSIMFTHDTMAQNLSNGSSHAGSKKLTQAFRDIIGQARFKDPYRKNGTSIDETDLDKQNIPHVELNDSSKYSAGISLAYGDRLEVTKVKAINSAQMTDYPFNLSEEKDVKNNKIVSVGKTHQQWYQLNLEDEDVVPWYNIIRDRALDSGDSRNFYYTYSKGNITYSGTGDGNSNNDCTIEEYKLFINTIVKADRSANHAPEILCSIPKEYKEANVDEKTNEEINEIPSDVDYIFNVGARDSEKDNVIMHATIDGKELNEENVNMDELKDYDAYKNKIKIFEVDTSDSERSPLEIKIPREKIAKIGDTVTVEIEAKDEKGAKSRKKYMLKAIEAPKFEIEAELDTENLTRVNKNDEKIMSDVKDNIIKVKKEDKVYVNYKVTPKELNYGSKHECEQKELVVLIDESISKNDWGKCKDALDKNFIHKFKGNSQDKNIYCDVIVYGKNVEELTCSSTNTVENQMYLKITDVENHINSKSATKNLGKAIEKSIDFFDKNNLPESSKNIIIISNKEPTDKDKIEDLPSIVSGNYNVLTLALNDFDELKAAHENTGGLECDYFTCDSNNIYDNMKKITKRIEVMKYKTYLLKDVKINFDFGNDIDLVSGLEKKENASKKYYGNLPNVKYIVKTDDNGNLILNNDKLQYVGHFIYSNTNENKEIYNINFFIKANLHKGECHFGKDNEVSYEYENEMIGRNSIDKTPILLVKSIEVDHGVYKEINQGIAKYADERNYVEGSVVTFASNIIGLNEITNLKLEIDKRSQCVKEPVIYKVDSDNNVEKIKDLSGNYLTLTKKDDSTYELSNFPGDKVERIIVIYSVKLKQCENNKYVNTIVAGDEKKDIGVFCIKGELPELF